jgi:hypothetical protein
MMTSAFEVAGESVAEQVCRAAIGAGMQARKHTLRAPAVVLVDHLASEQDKVDRLVRTLDPDARRTDVDGD